MRAPCYSVHVRVFSYFVGEKGKQEGRKDSKNAKGICRDAVFLFFISFLSFYIREKSKKKLCRKARKKGK